jgi:hypothetical protein
LTPEQYIESRRTGVLKEIAKMNYNVKRLTRLRDTRVELADTYLIDGARNTYQSIYDVDIAEIDAAIRTARSLQ